MIVLLPALAQKRHADQAGTAGGVADHLAIAGLEDVERQHDLREEDDVRQGEDRNDVGQGHVAPAAQARQRP